MSRRSTTYRKNLDRSSKTFVITGLYSNSNMVVRLWIEAVGLISGVFLGIGWRERAVFTVIFFINIYIYKSKTKDIQIANEVFYLIF